MQNETNNPQWDNEQKEPSQHGHEENFVSEETPEVGSPEREPVIVSEESTQQESPAAVPVKESGFKRFLRFLFGADTPVGRVMRPMLRMLAVVVITFTSGLLLGYLTLYRPARIQYYNAVAEIQQLGVQLHDAQSAITVLEGEKVSMQEILAGQQVENELVNYKVYFLIAKNDVLRARLALLDEKNGPGGPTAISALGDLETHLADLLPYVEADDPVLADLLTSRLDVVKNELARDSEQAIVELESFYTNLLEVEETLFE